MVIHNFPTQLSLRYEMGAFKGRGSNGRDGGDVRSEAVVPAGQNSAEFAIQESCSDPEKAVCPALCPAHLLTLVHPVIDEPLDRRFERCGCHSLACVA